MTTFMPTKYLVSLLPADHVEAVLFGLEVEWRGVPWQVPDNERADWDRVWAVTHHARVLTEAGGFGHRWELEPQPSSRTLDWYRTHRFTLDEAVRLARQHAHYVVVNGVRVQDVLGR